MKIRSYTLLLAIPNLAQELLEHEVLSDQVDLVSAPCQDRRLLEVFIYGRNLSNQEIVEDDSHKVDHENKDCPKLEESCGAILSFGAFVNWLHDIAEGRPKHVDVVG